MKDAMGRLASVVKEEKKKVEMVLDEVLRGTEESRKKAEEAEKERKKKTEESERENKKKAEELEKESKKKTDEMFSCYDKTIVVHATTSLNEK